jgi:bifunctional isochorismate lyase/aryl carrier protein
MIDIVRLSQPAAPLDRERMRADIAAMLHESPEEIGGDVSLMDLGLDSMRAMNLVLLWSSSVGNLEFSEFAERPTLNGWWALVAGKLGVEP